MVSIAQEHAQFELQIAHHNNIRLQKCDREFVYHSQEDAPDRARQPGGSLLWHHVQDVDPGLFIGDRQNRKQDAGIGPRVVSQDIVASPAMRAQFNDIHTDAAQEMIMEMSAFDARAEVHPKMMR